MRAGEAIFKRETCDRCHTVLLVPPDAGPADLPAPQSTDLLSSRVGPDLGLEGHRRSDDWQYAHLYAPDAVSPGSRMPASRHLFRSGGEGPPIPTEEGRALVAWLQTLGRGRRDIWAEFRSREPDIPTAPAVPPAARTGERLYERHCLPCHGAEGDGRGPAAPLLVVPPRDFTRDEDHFRSHPPGAPPDDADRFRTLTIGTGTGAAMPGFYFLSAAERWAVLGRLRAFSRRAAASGGEREPARAAAPEPVPAAPPDAPPSAAASLAEAGARLYTALGCAACHGPDGSGRPATAPARPGEIAATPTDLRHACSRRGGGSNEAFRRSLVEGVGSGMPSYAAALHDPEAETRALLAWLERPGPGSRPVPNVPDR